MAANPEDLFPTQQANQTAATPPIASMQQAIKGPVEPTAPATANVIGDLTAAPKDTSLFSMQAGSTATPTMSALRDQAAAPAASPTPALGATGPTQTGTGASTIGPFNQPDKTFEPVTSVVDPATETVQGQLKGLFDEGNPLMVQAKNRAEATAAGRGLQNSSLAAGAGELAMFNAAMPIAQQDAATYSQRAMANAQTANEFRMAEMTHYQRMGELKEQGNINAYLAGLQAGYEKDLAVLQGQITKEVHVLDAANDLIKLAAQGDVDSRLMAEKYGFDSALSAEENLHRLEQLAAQGDVNAKLQLQQFTYDSLLKDKDAALAITLEDKRIQATQNNILLEYEQRGLLSAQEAADEMERLNQQHSNTLEQIAAQAEAQGGENAKARSDALQAQYLTAVSARQASASAEITQIYATPKLSATQQNVAAQNIKNRLDADLAALAAYYASAPGWEGETFDPLDPNYAPAQTPIPPATPTNPRVSR